MRTPVLMPNSNYFWQYQVKDKETVKQTLEQYSNQTKFGQYESTFIFQLLKNFLHWYYCTNVK